MAPRKQNIYSFCLGGRDKLRRALSIPIGLAFRDGGRNGSTELLIAFDVCHCPIASMRKWDYKFHRWRFQGWAWTWRVSSDGVVGILDMTAPYKVDAVKFSHFQQRRMFRTDRLLIDGPGSDAEVLNFRSASSKSVLQRIGFWFRFL